MDWGFAFRFTGRSLSLARECHERFVEHLGETGLEAPMEAIPSQGQALM